MYLFRYIRSIFPKKYKSSSNGYNLGRWSNVGSNKFPSYKEAGYDCAHEFRLEERNKVKKTK